jgi:hypothetical protein
VPGALPRTVGLEEAYGAFLALRGVVAAPEIADVQPKDPKDQTAEVPA